MKKIISTLAVFAHFFSGLAQSADTALTVRSADMKHFEAVLTLSRVDLSWYTTSEMNNDYFTIERSADGILFEALAKVEGAHSSSLIIHYSVSDDQPLAGVSYYRLIQTDFNGTNTCSNVLVVHNSLSSDGFSLKLFPNPGKGDNVTVYFNSGSAASLHVVDLAGNLVYSDEQLIPGVYNMLNLENKLSPGVYLLSVNNGSTIETQRMFIQ
jgi:hypothetical protein